MYIYTFATVIVHIYMVTVDVHPIILLISQFRTFFSLSSPCAKRTQSQTSPLLIFFFLRYTQTHPHKHIHKDKSTQRYTNTPTQTNQHKEREIGVGVSIGRLDQWVGVGGKDQSLWVDGNGSTCL